MGVVWLLLTSGCLHEWCSPDSVSGVLPLPAFLYEHPTQQLHQVWTFDSTVHFCTGHKTSLPAAEIWTGDFSAYTMDIILFLPSFSQSSWKTTKSEINFPSQMRLLSCCTCNQDSLQFALSSRLSVAMYHPATDGASLPYSPPFPNYQTWKQHPLQAFSSQVHVSRRVKDFSSFQEHRLLRHLSLQYITKQEPSHGSDFCTTGPPAAGNGEPECLTGLKRTFLLLIFPFPGLQHFS